MGYKQVFVNHSVKEFVNGMAGTGIESVWALLKRMHYGTHHHFSRKHLARYVDECAFRLNEGNVEIDTMDRIKSVFKNANNGKITYKELIA